jgi:hypothetical protein
MGNHHFIISKPNEVVLRRFLFSPWRLIPGTGCSLPKGGGGEKEECCAKRKKTLCFMVLPRQKQKLPG